MLLTVAWMGPAVDRLKLAIAGFLVFRVLDVVKPPPAYQLQSLPRGWGVMADDIMAAIYGNVLLRLGDAALAAAAWPRTWRGRPMKLEILTIGGEILNGRTLDTNFHFLARQLDAPRRAAALAHHGARPARASAARARRPPWPAPRGSSSPADSAAPPTTSRAARWRRSSAAAWSCARTCGRRWSGSTGSAAARPPPSAEGMALVPQGARDPPESGGAGAGDSPADSRRRVPLRASRRSRGDARAGGTLRASLHGATVGRRPRLGAHAPHRGRARDGAGGADRHGPAGRVRGRLPPALGRGRSAARPPARGRADAGGVRRVDRGDPGQAGGRRLRHGRGSAGAAGGRAGAGGAGCGSRWRSRSPGAAWARR